jgi:hypothetical protein
MVAFFLYKKKQLLVKGLGVWSCGGRGCGGQMLRDGVTSTQRKGPPLLVIDILTAITGHDDHGMSNHEALSYL